jgi:hypothetical protein
MGDGIVHFWPDAISWRPGARWLLIRQPHNERQSDIDSHNVLVVETTNPPSEPLAPNRHGLQPS